MLSIHNSLPALTVTRNLAANVRTQSSAMEKLSSGFRINKASDDPAGLVLSEKLRAQVEGLDRAIRNTDDSNSLLGIMEGGLGQVQSILSKMKTLAIAASNTGVTTSEQSSAYQAELDNGLLAINDILQTTNMGGKKLLNNIGLFGEDDSNQYVQLTKPQGTQLDRKNSGFADLLDTNNKLGADYTMKITGLGENGDEETSLSFKKGQSLDDILKTIRAFDPTAAPAAEEGEGAEGETADSAAISPLSLTGTMNLNELQSLKNMDDDKAKEVLSATFRTANTSFIDANGSGALSKSDQMLHDVSNTLSNLGLGNIGKGWTDHTGGYDEFGNSLAKQYSLNDLFSGGDASLTRNPALALQVLKDSHSQVGNIRAQIGATQAMNEHLKLAKQAELENVTKMESMIRDTDMAVTVAEYSKANILAQMGTNLLRSVSDNSKMILDLFA